MKEIEIKAHAGDMEKMAAIIDSFSDSGRKAVKKHDLYFHRPGETLQALRIRHFADHLEVTAKKQFKDSVSEENQEYEFSASLDQAENLKAFFLCLGYEEYFVKEKTGFEWYFGPVHVELLKVNDLGVFLEMEYLLDFSSSKEDVEHAQKKLYHLLHLFGLDESDVEMKSYREMILGV